MKSQPLWLALLCLALIQPLQAAPLSQSAQTDPVHQAGDGVIRLYGPGGPDTALKRAAAAFQQETGIPVEVTAGPEHSWRDRAVKDADLIFAGADMAGDKCIVIFELKKGRCIWHVGASVSAARAGKYAPLSFCLRV